MLRVTIYLRHGAAVSGVFNQIDALQRIAHAQHRGELLGFVWAGAWGK